MQYLALLYDNENSDRDLTPEQQGEVIKRYFAFNEEAKAAGVFVAGEALKPTSTATSIRNRDGKMLMTDGPFAETKEQLGGFYLLDCKDLDEALAWAAKIPAADTGTVEVRPILDVTQFSKG